MQIIQSPLGLEGSMKNFSGCCVSTSTPHNGAPALPKNRPRDQLCYREWAFNPYIYDLYSAEELFGAGPVPNKLVKFF